MSKATIVASTKRFITVVVDAVKGSDKEDNVKYGGIATTMPRRAGVAMPPDAVAVPSHRPPPS